MKGVAVVAILAGTATADPAPKPLPARYPATGCVGYDDPKTVAVRTEVARRSEIAYDAALAKLGIQRATLQGHAPTVTKPGVVEATTSTNIRGTFIVSDVPLGELGLANGKLFPLRPTADASTTTTIVVCGCKPQRCATPSPVYRPPRAVVAEILVMYGPLPANTTYETAARTVRFSSPSLQIEYTRQTCPEEKRCVLPK